MSGLRGCEEFREINGNTNHYKNQQLNDNTINSPKIKLERLSIYGTIMQIVYDFVDVAEDDMSVDTYTPCFAKCASSVENDPALQFNTNNRHIPWTWSQALLKKHVKNCRNSRGRSNQICPGDCDRKQTYRHARLNENI